jgi:hypothetical protein
MLGSFPVDRASSTDHRKPIHHHRLCACVNPSSDCHQICVVDTRGNRAAMYELTINHYENSKKNGTTSPLDSNILALTSLLVAHSGCTDKLFLILYLGFWGFTLWLLVLANKNNGDPQRIVRGVDMYGRICGISDGVKVSLCSAVGTLFFKDLIMHPIDPIGSTICRMAIPIRVQTKSMCIIMCRNRDGYSTICCSS